jgi:hypothetical protein
MARTARLKQPAGVGALSDVTGNRLATVAVQREFIVGNRVRDGQMTRRYFDVL